MYVTTLCLISPILQEHYLPTEQKTAAPIIAACQMAVGSVFIDAKSLLIKND